MSFIKNVLLLGAGYVLGARAGHERYEQIKGLAHKVWTSGPVESGREKAKDAAASGFAKATEATVATAKSAAYKVKDKFTDDEVVDPDVIIVEPVEH